MTQQDVYNLLVSLGVKPEDAKKMVAISMAESGLNPQAINDTRGKKVPAGYEQELSVGLFQINVLAHYDDLVKEVGSNKIDDIVEWLKNPLNNIKYAVKLYKSSGLNPWSSYKSGAYIKYLDKINLQDSIPVIQQSQESTNFANWKPSSIWERAGMFIGGLVFIIFGIYLLFNLIKGSGENG